MISLVSILFIDFLQNFSSGCKPEKIEYLEDDMSGRRHEKSLLFWKPTLMPSVGGEGELAAGCDIVHCLCLFVLYT